MYREGLGSFWLRCCWQRSATGNMPAPAPRPHGNVDGIMDEVKCVAVAPEVGIVGPHARSNKPG